MNSINLQETDKEEIINIAKKLSSYYDAQMDLVAKTRYIKNQAKNKFQKEYDISNSEDFNFNDLIALPKSESLDNYKDSVLSSIANEVSDYLFRKYFSEYSMLLDKEFLFSDGLFDICDNILKYDENNDAHMLIDYVNYETIKKPSSILNDLDNWWDAISPNRTLDEYVAMEKQNLKLNYKNYMIECCKDFINGSLPASYDNDKTLSFSNSLSLNADDELAGLLYVAQHQYDYHVKDNFDIPAPLLLSKDSNITQKDANDGSFKLIFKDQDSAKQLMQIIEKIKSNI